MSSACSANTAQMEKALQHPCSEGSASTMPFQPEDSKLNTNSLILIPCEEGEGFIESAKKNEDTRGGNVLRLHQRRFRLDLRKRFFTEWEVRHWNIS